MPASGFIWNYEGVIVTSHHVVEQDENIVIGLPDGSTTSATLVGRDPSTDVAVLRADVMLRAVAVPAGDHRIKFVYRPSFLPVARALTTVGIIGLIGLLALAIRESRVRPESERHSHGV